MRVFAALCIGLAALALPGVAAAKLSTDDVIKMAKAGVPESWITMLGILKTAGAVGLLIGIGVPLIGMAAAIGLILFFVGAIITHLRAHDYSFGLAVVFLMLAIAALVLRLASS